MRARLIVCRFPSAVLAATRGQARAIERAVSCVKTEARMTGTLNPARRPVYPGALFFPPFLDTP